MAKSNLVSTILLVAAAACFAAEGRNADAVNQPVAHEGLQWTNGGVRGAWGAEGWSGEMPPQFLSRHEQRALSEENSQTQSGSTGSGEHSVAGGSDKKERWVLGWCSRPCGSVTTCSYRCWIWA